MKGRRKVGNELIRSLIKSGGGNSYSLTLPIEVVRAFVWEKRHLPAQAGKLELSIDEKNKRITISDWPRKK